MTGIESNVRGKLGFFWRLALLVELIKFKEYNLKQKFFLAFKRVDKKNKFIEYIYSAKYRILQNLYQKEDEFIFLNFFDFPEKIRCLFAVLNEIFFENIYQVNNLKLAEDATIIDLGANIGFFSLFIKELYPNSRILAFEPEEENFKNLKNNLKNYKNIELFKKAAGDKNEEGEMFISNNILCHSINNSKDFDLNVSIEGKQKISIVKLDDFLEDRRIDLIKMDIEGYEYKAILGLEKIIREQKPALLVAVDHSKKQKEKIEKIVFSFNKDYQLKVLNDQNIYFS